jgi:uncharacterized protein YdeI (YjbR/CyaY-like superfamily)
LRRHHSNSQGVWLVLAKKGTTHSTTLSYDEALDEAICFGWIDGQLGRRDNATFRRRFTPRNARSPWSQRNVAIAERLSSSGQMHRSGEDEIREAKADGRWNTAYAGQASMEVPEDFGDALIANPRAQARFQTLTSANRTPSSIGSKVQRRWRPEPDGSSSLWRCWRKARPSTRRVHDHLVSRSASANRCPSSPNS